MGQVSIWLLKIILKREVKVLLIMKPLTLETGTSIDIERARLREYS